MRRRLDKVGLIKSLIQDAMSKFRLSIIYYIFFIILNTFTPLNYK